MISSGWGTLSTTYVRILELAVELHVSSIGARFVELIHANMPNFVLIRVKIIWMADGRLRENAKGVCFPLTLTQLSLTIFDES
jgi:hypothetical protein